MTKIPETNFGFDLLRRLCTIDYKVLFLLLLFVSLLLIMIFFYDSGWWDATRLFWILESTTGKELAEEAIYTWRLLF